MTDQEHPLPYGWIKQFDRISNHPFWVDTKANPPRSIWTHPYEDEQYLSDHPEVKEKIGKNLLPPDYDADTKTRRHSFSGMASDAMADGSSSSAPAPAKGSSSAKKRGFFAKLKDKAIGTKEEREAERRRWDQIQEIRRQQRAQERAAEQAYYNQLYQQEQVYGQDPYYGAQPYGPPMQYRRRGYGGSGYGGYGYGGGYGGGIGVPLAGGLLGGLLLGDILGGGLF